MILLLFLDCLRKEKKAKGDALAGYRKNCNLQFQATKQSCLHTAKPGLFAPNVNLHRITSVLLPRVDPPPVFEPKTYNLFYEMCIATCNLVEQYQLMEITSDFYILLIQLAKAEHERYPSSSNNRRLHHINKCLYHVHAPRLLKFHQSHCFFYAEALKILSNQCVRSKQHKGLDVVPSQQCLKLSLLIDALTVAQQTILGHILQILQNITILFN